MRALCWKNWRHFFMHHFLLLITNFHITLSIWLELKTDVNDYRDCFKNRYENCILRSEKMLVLGHIHFEPGRIAPTWSLTSTINATSARMRKVQSSVPSSVFHYTWWRLDLALFYHKALKEAAKTRRRGVERSVKALANEDTLLRTHCCRHKCFPVCPRA